jgi:signal transduction histidine kinase/tetratricopeptide (TPR) repeat protein
MQRINKCKITVICLMQAVWLWIAIIPARADTTDSLQMLINTAKNDSGRVMLYNTMIHSILNPATQGHYLDSLYLSKAQLYADSGLTLARNIVYNEGEIEIIHSIGAIYFYSQRYEEAIRYYKQSCDIATQYGNEMQKANAMYDIGITYLQLGQNMQALECMNLVSSLIQNVVDVEWMYDINLKLSEIRKNLKEYTYAIDAGKQALAIAHKFQDTIKMANIYTDMAESYLRLGHADSCRILYETAIKWYQKKGNHQLAATAMRDYAVTVFQQTNMKKALEWLERSSRITEYDFPNDKALSETCRIISDIYRDAGQQDSADLYKKKALQKALKANSIANLADTYLWLGNRSLENEQWDEAEKYFQLARQNNRYAGSIATRVQILDYLGKVYGSKGDNRRMVLFSQSATELHDSLAILDNQRRLNILQMHYETREKREQKELELRSQAEQQEQDISHSWRIIIFSLIVLGLLTFLLIKVIRNFLSVRKNNQLLQESHKQMLLVQEQLSISNQELNMYKIYLEDMVEEKAAEQAQKDMQLYGLANNLSGSFIYRKIVEKNNKEQLSYISSNIYKLYDVSADSLIGSENFNSLWGDDDVKGLKKMETAYAATMEPFRYEFSTMRNGQSVWLMICAFPQYGDNETIIWDGFVMDITPQKEKEQVLKIAKDKAEESDRLKSVFLSNMSHEIRTPMNAIMGFIGFVENENLSPEKRHKYIGTIRNSVDQLLKLVENIIDISKLEISQLKILPAEFAVNELMHELEAVFTSKTQGKLLFFELDDGNFLKKDVIFNDRMRIQQVLHRLLDNAFKYTEKGYIRFGYREDKGTDELLFFVEDTGIGIPYDQQEVIFEYFRQSVDTELKPKYGGTGLGLSISKGLVEAMKGKIWVESKLGDGSTFFFSIPKHLKSGDVEQNTDR